MTPKQKDFAKLQASSTQESSYIFSTGAPRSRYCSLAYLVDDLGYRNILEGRIPKMFYDVRSADIQRRGLRKHAGHQCNGLILRLLQITHRQWTFRCGTVHLRGPDGLTSSQRDRLACKCEELVLWTDPTTLLDEDRYLLNIHFEALGDAPPLSTRQAWLSEMEAARCVTHQNDSIADDPWIDTRQQMACSNSLKEEKKFLMAQAVALRAWKRKAFAHGCLI